MPRAFLRAIGLAQIVSWGTTYYAFPLIGERMRAELGWDRPTIYVAASAGLLLAAVVAVPVGNAIDRGFGRLVMAGGSVAAAICLAVWSQSAGVATFVATIVALGAVQATILYEPAFAVVARRLGPARSRPGITAVTLWAGFASTIFIPTTQVLVDALGWRGTLHLFAVFNLLVAALYWSVIDSTADRSPPGATVTDRGVLRNALRSALGMQSFWLLAIAFTAYAAFFSAFTFHLYPLLVERGLDAGSVASIMMVIGPAQVLGRVLVWRLAPQYPVRIIGSVVVSVFPLAIAMLLVPASSLLLVGAVLLAYGLANGIMTIVQGMAVPEMLGRREAYGTLNGAIAAPATLVRALAPGAAALLWQGTRSYDHYLIALEVTALLLMTAFWAAAALARPRDEAPIRDAPRRRAADSSSE